MSVYQPTLKQLQYLVALHEHGHFGRAAEACFVSQSTLSAGLRDLETLLGVVLVERTKRNVRFTPLGNAVVAKSTASCARRRNCPTLSIHPPNLFRARCG
jgi:LysR family hydrogen peroxide-inducible transcriptional activator